MNAQRYLITCVVEKGSTVFFSFLCIFGGQLRVYRYWLCDEFCDELQRGLKNNFSQIKWIKLTPEP